MIRATLIVALVVLVSSPAQAEDHLIPGTAPWWFRGAKLVKQVMPSHKDWDPLAHYWREGGMNMELRTTVVLMHKTESRAALETHFRTKPGATITSLRIEIEPAVAEEIAGWFNAIARRSRYPDDDLEMICGADFIEWYFAGTTFEGSTCRSNLNPQVTALVRVLELDTGRPRNQVDAQLKESLLEARRVFASNQPLHPDALTRAGERRR